MAVYYFHSQTESRFTDDEGVEFATPREARAQAVVTCAQMVKDAPDGFWGSRPWTVTVTDAAGLILWVMTVDGFASPATRTFD